jgi:hypothetical protein
MSTVKRRNTIESRIGSIVATTDLSEVTLEDKTRLATAYFQFNTSVLLPVSLVKSLGIINKHILSNHFVCFIKDENEYVGFLLAIAGSSEVSDCKLLQQTFYFSTLKSTKSVKAIWAAHRVMREYAKNNEIDFCVSGCSQIDEAHVFNKILSKDGWYSEGHLSSYNVRNTQ